MKGTNENAIVSLEIEELEEKIAPLTDLHITKLVEIASPK